MFLAKMFLFFKRQDKWVDKDGHDRDPHACLKKDFLKKFGDSCGVCGDPALRNGSKTGKNHRRLQAGQDCRVCENYPKKAASSNSTSMDTIDGHTII